jgi:hypothetical protein
MSSISGCISTGDLPGANTYSQNGSNWEWRSPICIGSYTFSYTNHTQTNLDLRNTTVGYGFHFKIEILERFQSHIFRMIVDAPWYVPNTVIRRDLQIPTIKEEIRHYSSQYSARLSVHLDVLAVNLTKQSDNIRRLRRHLPNDLPTRL